jgi:carnitine O-palmitoyltransferase 2
MAKQAVQGQGCDRHLYALKSIASASGPTHPLLTDPIFTRSSSFQISSSNVTAPFIDLFGFGPVVSDGYGIGYMIFADHVPMNITSFSGTGTSSSAMAESIKKALLDVKKLHE